MPEEKIVMIDSDECFETVTRTFLKSRNGFYYTPDNERSARFDGCTHVYCDECGKPVEKMWTACHSCREKKAYKRYDEYEKAEFTIEHSFFYSEVFDEYFTDTDTLLEFIHELAEPEKWLPIDARQLRLLHCQKIQLRSLSADYWCDCFPEDCDCWNELEDAIDNFNFNVLRKIEPIALKYVNIAVIFAKGVTDAV